jgi:L-ascorbate metabolism protein UlaG (beta-lactamase superfamily)
MKITKFEQSGFVLESDSGFKLAIDIGNKTSAETIAQIGKVDAFIVSHIHGDHFVPDYIVALQPQLTALNVECMHVFKETTQTYKGNTIILAPDQLSVIGSFKIFPFTVDHGPNISKPIENLGFLIKADEQQIYFAGDMFNPSGIDVTELEVDYALLPVGGFYTFGPKEAFAFYKTFKKVGKVIPMHYEKTPETKDEFEKMA